ncbi:hypothetical protein B0H14DRAFT_2792875 [Mycena olivaceomarginata]|nr:hypothetical protein B0H14DRAFT_2792875 [Mycena olivaceomarginata]
MSTVEKGQGARAVFLAVLFAAVVLAFFAAGAFGVGINLKIRVFAVALGAALVVAFFAGTGLEVAALSSLVEPVDRRVLLRVPRVDEASASPVSSARFRCMVVYRNELTMQSKRVLSNEPVMLPP